MQIISDNTYEDSGDSIDQICQKDQINYPKHIKIEQFTQKHKSCPQYKLQQQDQEIKDEVEKCRVYYECMRLNKRISTSIQRLTQETVAYSLKGDMNVLIFYKLFDDECKFIVKEIVELLISLNCNVFLENPQFDEIKEITHTNRLFLINQDQVSQIALVIIVGGDGTVLYALKKFQTQDPPPILAFQKGTLGFMCVFDLKEKNNIITNQIDHFKTSGSFVVETKLRLRGVLTQQQNNIFEYQVLNEFVITRGANPHCLYIEIYINDVLLTIASGDGIIVSTPTGSTAYFLSAGGPIIQNEVPSISIAPICPLSLSFRPIVLPTCLNIKIKLSKQCRANGFICADGQITKEFCQDMILEISKSESSVSIIQNKQDIDYSEWIHNLRKKLSWNKVFTDQKKQKSNL